MGTVKIRLEGTTEDVTRIHEFMRYHTKGITDENISFEAGTLGPKRPCVSNFEVKL